MCQSHTLPCSCGARAAEIFFRDNVFSPSTVRSVYCPACSRQAAPDVTATVRDNGWLLELDPRELVEQAPRIGLEPDGVTAERVFDAGFVTWVGFGPEDNVERAREREALAEQYAGDKRGHFVALKRWAMEREQRLAEAGWRKARRSVTG